MIETWLNLFGLLSGAFLLIDFQLQAPALHGDSHEKWIKETGLDISAGSRAEDNGPQENPRRPNCQEVETDRRRHAPKSVQYGIVTRLALTTRSLRIFLQRSPASRGAFFLSNGVASAATARRAASTSVTSSTSASAAPPRANSTGRLFNFRLRARRNRHLRAGVRQRRGRRKPDPAPAAGDERAPAVEAEGRSFREVNRVCVTHALFFPKRTGTSAGRWKRWLGSACAPRVTNSRPPARRKITTRTAACAQGTLRPP